MSKIISKETIVKVKGAFNLSEYAAAHTSLRLVDGAIRGPSPFVDDSEETFSIDMSKQRFTCKATGQSGDIIAYERALNGTGFVETVEFLAMLKGIEVVYSDRKTTAWKPSEKSKETQNAA